MVFAMVRAVSRLALGLFYRWHVEGPEIPARGPVVVVANHLNGLIDPVAVLRLTDRPLRLLAKAPLFKMPVLGAVVRGMGCLPVYRKQDDATQMGGNDATFEAAHAALLQGDGICLFPEGKSHSEPSLEPLKTGAARIALGARERQAADVGEPVRIVPVGFAWRDRGIFRSDAAAVVGEPIVVPHPQGSGALDARALTEAIDKGLRAVTLNLESWDLLPLLATCEAVWLAERGEAAGERRIAEAFRALREQSPESIEPLRRQLSRFARALARTQLTVPELDRVGSARAARFAVAELARWLLLGPLAVVGTLAWRLPYVLPRFVVRLLKVEGDLEATGKVLLGLLLWPAWFAGLTVLGAELGGLWGALLLGPGTTAAALLALLFFEDEAARFADVRAWLLLRGNERFRTRMLERRRALADALGAAAARLAPAAG